MIAVHWGDQQIMIVTMQTRGHRFVLARDTRTLTLPLSGPGESSPLVPELPVVISKARNLDFYEKCPPFNQVGNWFKFTLIDTLGSCL